MMTGSDITKMLQEGKSPKEVATALRASSTKAGSAHSKPDPHSQIATGPESAADDGGIGAALSIAWSEGLIDQKGYATIFDAL